MTLTDLIPLINFGVLVIMFATPPLFLLWIYIVDRRQSQHAVLRNFPLLGRVRYLLEQIGPELRQYFFDSDMEGKPFARSDYQGIVRAGKYQKTLMSFGSKRDFEAEGWYLRNALFPRLDSELEVELEPRVSTRRYVLEDEGLFQRKEHVISDDAAPWLLTEASAPVLGADLPFPWRPRGLVGMSAMSYGALGSHAIRAMSLGLAGATGTWMNTGEGGLSEHHLVGGSDLVFQIGPGLFGVRAPDGGWDWDAFRRQAEVPQVRGFELKFHQGAKVRGGHVEAMKVTPEVAALRGVPVGQPIDSPNRFEIFSTPDELLEWVARMRREGGKPVGVKLTVGGPGFADELAATIASRGEGPDWIAVDGGEGGSGATYQEMADTMGLPLRSGIVVVEDALCRHGIRDRVRLFASGKLSSPDRIALALALGADFANIARGLMISVGCIQAQRCHLNTCPVGVATTDPELMQALVVDEKRYRVQNYVITLRAGLYRLAAAAGLSSPTEFRRKHAVYRDRFGRTYGADELFPYPAFPDAVAPDAAFSNTRPVASGTR